VVGTTFLLHGLDKLSDLIRHLKAQMSPVGL
jgi:hypothetical protein